jgi:hypothetical protein
VPPHPNKAFITTANHNLHHLKKNKKYDHIVDLNLIYNASAMHFMIKFNNHATNFLLRRQRILPTTIHTFFPQLLHTDSAPSHSRLSLNLLHGSYLLFFNLKRVSAPFFRRQMLFLFTGNATDDILLSAMIFDVGTISGSDFL